MHFFVFFVTFVVVVWALSLIILCCNINQHDEEASGEGRGERGEGRGERGEGRGERGEGGGIVTSQSFSYHHSGKIFKELVDINTQFSTREEIRHVQFC